MNDDNAKLILGTETLELPLRQPTLGIGEVDVSALGASGVFTFDPGFTSTASCESKITFIDGLKGILLYRGYPIEQLAEHSCFLETGYLILNGELPTPSQQKEFSANVTAQMIAEPQLHTLIKSFDKNAHPMAIITAALAGLAAIYHNQIDNSNPADRIDVAIKFLAKIPTLTAMCYRHGRGESFLAPNPEFTYAENFLYMMSGKKPDAKLAKAMDTIFILHADHEQNASTSTVRLSGSTGTDPFAAFAAGAAALWGPAHGGANEAALNMLHKIGDIAKIPEYIAKAKDKNDPFRLMGFGHRVYKNYDPRAKVMQRICHDVLEATNSRDGMTFKIAMELEHIALSDPYFIERKLYPNVDFYSGITQSALGIPANLFTAVFTLGRSIGWAAHWHEMLSSPLKIGRPRQLYTGAITRDYPKNR